MNGSAARRRNGAGRHPHLVTRALGVTAALALALSACTSGGGATEPDEDSSAIDDAAVSGEPREGGELIIGADADPIGLDPVLTNAFSSYDFMDLIYSGLLRWTPDMEIEPDLAVSYENPDPTTYIFTLREGVMFHNGQSFSADDVKYTFDRILDPDEGSPRLSEFENIDAVEVIDPTTVKFTLKGPDAAFLAFMATKPNSAIVPQGVDGLVDNPVGTGPFAFESYAPNQELRLVANEDYYEEGLPYLDAVTFRFFGDQASLVSALRSNAVHMTWLKDPKVATTVAGDGSGLVSAPGQTSRTFPVWFNVSVAPFDDVRVRQALSLAIDRESILNTVLAGSGEIAGRIPSSQVGGYVGDGSDLPNYTQDVDAAKELLADAGYPDGIDLGEYKVVAANDLDVQAAQLLQEQWAAAGISVDLNPMETAPLLDDWAKGNFGMLSVALSWTSDPDAILGRIRSTSSYGAAMGMSDTELDAMMTAARAELDPDARAEINLEIQQRIAENAYVLDIYGYPLRWEMWDESVHGYEAMAANSRAYVRTTWIEE